MAVENFYTYPEVDALSRLVAMVNRVTFTDMLGGDNQIYTYKDKGVGYFSGDFIHLFTFKITTTNADAHVMGCALANALDDYKGLEAASESGLFLWFSHSGGNTFNILIQELDSGVVYQVFSSPLPSVNTVYYAKVVRDESVGTYGTVYLYIYTDAARTTLLSTTSLAMHTSKKDYRYIFPVISYDHATENGSMSGYVEDFDLQNSSVPVLTQQPITAVASTTATGHGTIISLGVSAVTEHGHCWNTATAPTTANSKTTNGAGVIGKFTSAITGLTPGTKYYVRAYANNTQGTGYSDELSFTSGQASTQKVKGKIFIKGTDFHYVGHDGIERKITGTVV